MNTLILVAILDELGGCFEDLKGGHQVVVMGVGKVNAAMTAERAILTLKPKRVLNFGTAGSPYYPKKSLVKCGSFQDRDMDCRLLGLRKGITPYEDSNTAVIGLENGIPEHRDPKAECFTGDKFLSAEEMKPYYPGVIDMEAYAIAKVVLHYQMPFACVKYITDGTSLKSAEDWRTHMKEGGLHFRKYFDLIEGK